jgi:hypothetical protein
MADPRSVGVEERMMFQTTTTTSIKQASNKQQTMGRSLRSGNATEFDPSLLGRAGRISKKCDGVDDNDDRGVTTRARSEAENHQEDRRQQARSKIPEAPPTPDRAALLLDKEKGRGRATRGTKPTCLHFGLYEDRCSRYPNHFFCDRCKHWEDEHPISDNKSRMKRDSIKYKCEGRHENWIYPTTLKSSKCHYLLASEEFSDDDDDDEDDEISDDDTDVDVDVDVDEDEEFNNLQTASPQQEMAPSPVTAHNNRAAVSPDENATQRTTTPANDTVPKSQYNLLLKKYEQLAAKHQQLLQNQECPEKICLRIISPPSLLRDTAQKKKKRISKFISILMDRNFSNGGTFQEIVKQSIQFFRDEVFSGKLLLLLLLLFHFIIIQYIILLFVAISTTLENKYARQ